MYNGSPVRIRLHVQHTSTYFKHGKKKLTWDWDNSNFHSATGIKRVTQGKDFVQELDMSIVLNYSLLQIHILSSDGEKISISGIRLWISDMGWNITNSEWIWAENLIGNFLFNEFVQLFLYCQLGKNHQLRIVFSDSVNTWPFLFALRKPPITSLQ